MYLATSPVLAPTRRAGWPELSLRVARIESRVFGSGPAYAGDPLLEEYLTDVAGLYGRAFRPDLLEAGRRNTFTQMAAEVVAGLGPGEPLDLLVIAHATPDSDPRRSTACYLTEAVPVRGTAFAVSDQGGLAPFTGLRVLADFARASGARRALFLVLDQGTLPYQDPLPGPPAEDVAVAVLLAPAGPAGGVALTQQCDLAVRDLPAAIEAALPAGPAPLTVIAGPGLDPRLDLPPVPGEVIAAPAGRPCTGTWSVLAERLAGWRDGGRRVLIADYDRDQRDLGLCRLQVDGARSAAAAS